VVPAGNHSNRIAGHAINQPVLVVDAPGVQRRVFVVAQSLGFAYSDERVTLNGVQEIPYSSHFALVYFLPVGKVISPVGGEINSPL
jgi:hypothetical protein